MKKLNLWQVWSISKDSHNFYDFSAEVCLKIAGIPLTVKKDNIENRLKLVLEPEIRNIKMNALYWVYLTVLEVETGNDKNNLHEYFKQKFLQRNLITVFEEEIQSETSTTKLTKKEFVQYLEKIQIFALTELSIKLYSKDDKEFENFLEFHKDYV